MKYFIKLIIFSFLLNGFFSMVSLGINNSQKSQLKPLQTDQDLNIDYYILQSNPNKLNQNIKSDVFPNHSYISPFFNKIALDNSIPFNEEKLREARNNKNGVFNFWEMEVEASKIMNFETKGNFINKGFTTEQAEQWNCRNEARKVNQRDMDIAVKQRYGNGFAINNSSNFP